MDECTCGNDCSYCEGCGEFECQCVCDSELDDEEYDDDDDF